MPSTRRIRPSVRWLRVILVLGAFLHLSGGHYGVLQCVAWTKMLIDYSSHDGLLEGARKTFDGSHPCSLCKSIANARQQDSGQDEPAPAAGVDKLSLKDLRLAESISLKDPPFRDQPGSDYGDPRALAGLSGDSPPSPPPKGV